MATKRYQITWEPENKKKTSSSEIAALVKSTNESVAKKTKTPTVTKSTLPTPKVGTINRNSGAKVLLPNTPLYKQEMFNSGVKLPTIKGALKALENSAPNKIMQRAADTFVANLDKAAGVDPSLHASFKPDTNMVESAIGDIGGTIASIGGRLPGTGASMQSAFTPAGNAASRLVTKGLTKVSPNLPSTASKVVDYAIPTLAKEGTEGALYGAAISGASGDNMEDSFKTVGRNALENAVGGFALKGAGDVFSHTLGKLGKVKVTGESNGKVDYVKEDGSTGTMSKVVFDKEATPLTVNEGLDTLNQSKVADMPTFKGGFDNKVTNELPTVSKVEQPKDDNSNLSIATQKLLKGEQVTNDDIVNSMPEIDESKLIVAKPIYKDDYRATYQGWEFKNNGTSDSLTATKNGHTDTVKFDMGESGAKEKAIQSFIDNRYSSNGNLIVAKPDEATSIVKTKEGDFYEVKHDYFEGTKDIQGTSVNKLSPDEVVALINKTDAPKSNEKPISDTLANSQASTLPKAEKSLDEPVSSEKPLVQVETNKPAEKKLENIDMSKLSKTDQKLFMLKKAVVDGGIDKLEMPIKKSHGMNKYMKQDFATKLAEGLKGDTETIKIDVENDGKFEIKNDPTVAASLLKDLGFKAKKGVEATAEAKPTKHRYYLTQRPASLGTHPKGTTDLVNFDDKQQVDDIGREAWGYVEYDKPLTDAQISDYELTKGKGMDLQTFGKKADNPFHEKDVNPFESDEAFDLSVAQDDRRQLFLKNLIESNDAIEFKTNMGNVTISPSTKGGKYQVTQFDKKGEPLSDYQADNINEVIDRIFTSDIGKEYEVVPKGGMNLQTFAGENEAVPITDNIKVPLKFETTNSKGKKATSKFYSNSLKETEILPDDVKGMLEEHKYLYDVETNEGQIDDAARTIKNNGINEEIQRLMNSTSMLSGSDTMEHLLITKELLAEAQKTGDYSKLKRFTEYTQDKITQTAKGLQAVSAWKKITPEGVLLKATQEMKNAAKEIGELNPKLKGQVDDEIKAIKSDSKDQIKKEVDKLKEEAKAEIKKARETIKADKKKTLKEIEAAVKKAEEKIGIKTKSKIDAIEEKAQTDIQAKSDAILKKYNVPNITNADMKFIIEQADIASKLPNDSKDRDIALAKIGMLLANKIPKTFADKVKAAQRISMLFNTKTMVRNSFGNLIMFGAENIKDIPGMAIDKAISKHGIPGFVKPTEIRTTGKPHPLKQLGYGIKGGKEVIEDARLGIDRSPRNNGVDTFGQYELPMGNIWEDKGLGKVGNTLNRWTGTGLKMGDTPFYRAAEGDTLDNVRALNTNGKMTEEQFKDLGEYVAKDRTFQNDSNIAKGFEKLRKGINSLTGNEDLGLGNFIMPFVRTTGNILDKVVDYSPIATAKVIKMMHDSRTKGVFDQKKFVDTVSRGITGTGMIGLGYWLAQNGFLTGKGSDDPDVRAMDKQTGKNPYAVHYGDSYYTIDWAQPASVPLAIGADMYEGGQSAKEAQNAVMDAVASGGQTLFNQSLFQGVQKLFGGYDTVNSVENVVTSIPGQFMPTALKQVGQAIDSTQRNTYSANKVQSGVNQAVAKLPFLSKTLEPKINTLGEESKLYQGESNPLTKGFNIFLNPGTYTRGKDSAGTDIVKKIYDETGETIQFPRVADRTFKANGETIRLTPKEYTQYQTLLGQKTNAYLQTLSDNGDYEGMAKDIQNKITAINKEAKNEILSQRGLPMLKVSKK